MLKKAVRRSKTYYYITSDHIDWAARRLHLAPEEVLAKEPLSKKAKEDDGFPLTLNQLGKLADVARAPLGYFFLGELPEEQLPLPDFRTRKNVELQAPSIDLLETIYACQNSQDWYKDYATANDFGEVDFIGRAKGETDTFEVAEDIRGSLKLSIEQQAKDNRENFLKYLISMIEDLGVLVMVSGHVKTDNKRSLSLEEFRGFSLSDDLAPVIFVNGKDTKAGQIFTLVHELAHLWAGESALSDVRDGDVDQKSKEWWANAVANEVLLPKGDLSAKAKGMALDADDLDKLSDFFNVGTLIILTRLYRLEKLLYKEYKRRYEEEAKRLKEILEERKKNKKPIKIPDIYFYGRRSAVGSRFAKAVIEDTYEGNTLYRDAYNLLGVSSSKGLEKLRKVLV